MEKYPQRKTGRYMTYYGYNPSTDQYTGMPSNINDQRNKNKRRAYVLLLLYMASVVSCTFVCWFLLSWIIN